MNIINSEIKGLLYIESDPNYLIGIKTEGEIIKLENTNLINIEFQATNTYIIDNCIFEHYCGFNSVGDGQISNTKFKNLKGNIFFWHLKITNCEVNSNETNFCRLDAYNCTIEDTKFENINDITLHGTNLKNSTIYKVLELVMHENNRFESIVFDKCNSILLYGGNNKFYNSTFSNNTYNKEENQSESFIKYIIDKKDQLDTIIEGCLFKNIIVSKGFVIELSCFEKIKDIRVKIENCIFKNCKSENKSLVKLEDFYYPKFSKNSRHLILGQEKNNIGIENI